MPLKQNFVHKIKKSSHTWVASSMCYHCIDNTILQEKVISNICARGVIAFTRNNPLWACVSHLHLSKLDKRHWVKSRWELLSTLILKLECVIAQYICYMSSVLNDQLPVIQKVERDRSNNRYMLSPRLVNCDLNVNRQCKKTNI